MTALIEKHLRDDAEVEGFIDEVTDSTSQKLEALDSVFSKAAESDTPTEVTYFVLGFIGQPKHNICFLYLLLCILGTGLPMLQNHS